MSIKKYEKRVKYKEVLGNEEGEKIILKI